jgi:hypothetical protein
MGYASGAPATALRVSVRAGVMAVFVVGALWTAVTVTVWAPTVGRGADATSRA